MPEKKRKYQKRPEIPNSSTKKKDPVENHWLPSDPTYRKIIENFRKKQKDARRSSS